MYAGAGTIRKREAARYSLLPDLSKLRSGRAEGGRAEVIGQKRQTICPGLQEGIRGSRVLSLPFVDKISHHIRLEDQHLRTPPKYVPVTPPNPPILLFWWWFEETLPQIAENQDVINLCGEISRSACQPELFRCKF